MSSWTRYFNFFIDQPLEANGLRQSKSLLAPSFVAFFFLTLLKTSFRFHACLMALPPSSAVIAGPGDVTVEWLNAALGVTDLRAFSFEKIGTGQVGECYRVHLEYTSNESYSRARTVILKVAASDPQSRTMAQSLGMYQREVRFYDRLAPFLGGSAIAKCFHAAFDQATGLFCLLLEDAWPAITGNDVQGATLEQAKLAMTEIGRIHGLSIRDQSLDTGWLERRSPLTQAMLQNVFESFVKKFGGVVGEKDVNICRRISENFDAFRGAQTKSCVQGLIHGDYRLDNMLFGHDQTGPRLIVVDWQGTLWTSVLRDIAWFLGAALETGARRAQYHLLLRHYVEGLGLGTPLTLERCYEDLRWQSLWGPIQTVVALMLAEQTERGDQLLLGILQRTCQQVLDLRALDILPTLEQATD